MCGANAPLPKTAATGSSLHELNGAAAVNPLAERRQCAGKQSEKADEAAARRTKTRPPHFRDVERGYSFLRRQVNDLHVA